MVEKNVAEAFTDKLDLIAERGLLLVIHGKTREDQSPEAQVLRWIWSFLALKKFFKDLSSRRSNRMLLFRSAVADRNPGMVWFRTRCRHWAGLGVLRILPVPDRSRRMERAAAHRGRS